MFCFGGCRKEHVQWIRSRKDPLAYVTLFLGNITAICGTYQGGFNEPFSRGAGLARPYSPNTKY